MATLQDLQRHSQNPNVRRFLDMIAQAEGAKGYDTAFGGATLPSLADHPRQLHGFTQTDGQPNKTSAAGRYQFLQSTWDDVAGSLGLTDFGPESQDIAAIELLRRNGSLEPILAGDFDAAVQRSGSTWASLPSGPYPQPKRSAGFIARALDGAAQAIFPAANANPFDQFDPPEANPFDQFDAQPEPNPFDQFDAPEAPSKPQQSDGAPSRSVGQQIGRQLGLTGRAAISGLTALPNMLWNGPAGAANELFGTNIPMAQGSATSDYLGLPKPEGAVERVSQDVASSMAGAGGMLGLGSALSRAASPVATGIGGMLSNSAGVQTSSAALGSGAAASARETGFTPGQQMAIGIGASMLPTVVPYVASATARGAVRGGEAGRQQMIERINQFRAGTGQNPTVGQASGKTMVQGLENQLGKSLGSSGVMTRKVGSQVQALQDRVDDIATGLSPSAGAVEAGESIVQGLSGFKTGFKRLQGHLYDSLDDHLPGSTPIRVGRTQQALADLNADIEGAEAVSRMFKNAKIGGIGASLSDDLERSARAQIPAGGSLFNPPRPDTQSAALPYEAIKKLRSLVGEELADGSFMADVPRSKWKALYAALSEDLGDAATAAGPQARGAWEWANSFSRQQLQRLDDLAVVMNKDGPEKVFQAALSGTSEGNTVVKRVVDALPKQNRRDLAAAVIRRMGRATPGNQNEMGDVFSSETFLTNWNRLSKEAKQTLFGRLGVEGVEDALRKTSGAANILRESSRAMANPSGTGADIRAAAQLGGGMMALGLGQPVTAMGLLGALPALSYGAARGLSSPGILNWMARPTQLPSATAPSLMNELLNVSQRRETKRPPVR